KLKERRSRRRRSLVVLLMALALVGGAAYVVISVLGIDFSPTSSQKAVSDYPGPGQGSVDIVIAAGDSGAAIGATLAKADVVATAGAFTKAFNANPAAAGIQPGTYRLFTQMKASDAVSALLNPTSRVSFKVTIQEGLSVKEILAKISTATGIPAADLDAAAADTAALGLPAEAGGQLEGWLFPLTYQVEPGATASSVLAPMVAKTVAVLTAKQVPQAKWEDTLIRASLVEEEGKSPEDRAKIAQAIQNRLDIDMHLQIDASLAYGLGKPGTSLTNDDKLVDNPFNLENRVGLPPHPIDSPSEASIDAVLTPTPGDWLFWTAVNLDTGETKFATTLAEHNVNVAELRAWQKANGK
ncbi:MAG TPA: endolytic transglycosylase MltG, partial [Cellulomonas sp.]|uniref:endolytic transglycosylase MltG n=1 Tax=Cellulomonas sp. TaxID=40001 RepID=UPI002E3014CC